MAKLTNRSYDISNNVIFGTFLGEGLGKTDLTQFGSYSCVSIVILLSLGENGFKSPE
jgi:hypothetical protein